MKIDVEFKIENVPIHKSSVEREKFPFGKMKVGQSFHFSMGEIDVSLVRQAALQYGKRHNMKFSVVREGNGYRCGRIK